MIMNIMPSFHQKRKFSSLLNEFDINFKSLALEFPELQQFLQKGKLDFCDLQSCYVLTKILLLSNCQIKILSYNEMIQYINTITSSIKHQESKDFPFLIPPLPNRMNYINWLHLLFNEENDIIKQKNKIILDIGVGALCIYPLIGFSKYQWKFIASDIDSIAIQLAQKQIELNGIQAIEAITLQYVESCYNLQKCILRECLPISENSKTLIDFLNENKNMKEFRGPIRLSLLDKYNNIIQQLEDEYKDIRNDDEFIEDNYIIDAVMTNPPFYDIYEDVSSL